MESTLYVVYISRRFANIHNINFFNENGLILTDFTILQCCIDTRLEAGQNRAKRLKDKKTNLLWYFQSGQ